MKFLTITLIFSLYLGLKSEKINNSSLNIYANSRNVAREIIDLLNDVILYANDPIKKLDYLQTGISLIELLESNLIENSTHDEIITLLDILIQMNERSKFGCVELNEDYRFELTNKTRKLLSAFQNYTRQQIYTEETLQNIVSICKDNESGINGLLKLFRRILEKNEAAKYFRECNSYKSMKVVKWFDMIRQYSFVFISLVRACEYENLHKSDFDSYLFLEDINVLLKYYAAYTLLDEFVNDKSPHGLRESVRTILKEDLSAIETSNRLKSEYSFYNWEIIFYSNKLTGIESHFAYYSPQNFHCGSLSFYYDELNISKNALVSWCSPYLNDVVNMTEQLKPLNTRFNVKNPFENFNLDSSNFINAKSMVEVLIGYPDNIIKGLNYLLCTKDDQPNTNYSIIYTSSYFSYSKYWHEITCYASIRIENNCTMPQPMLTQIAIFFPDLEVNFHAKFEPYYKNLDARSPDQCWTYCKNESDKCVASSYKLKYDPILNLQSYSKVCFLHEKKFKLKKEHNWIGYSQTALVQNKPIINTNIKLSNPYKQFYSRSILTCWVECLKDSSCIAASYAKPDYYWYILPTQQCYLLVLPRCFLHSAEYEALKEVGWVSYTKEELNFNHTNIRFSKHYRELSNVRSSSSCWEKCKKEAKCVASSFGVINSKPTCFFLDEHFKTEKIIGWISHTANKLNISKFNIKLKDHFKTLVSESDYTCWEECLQQSNCIAISFANSTCMLFEMNETNSLQVTKETGWISYFPAFENIRLTNEYKVSSNETSAFECFEKCLNDTKCMGSSFSKSNNNNNQSNTCHLFEDGYEIMLEDELITYFKFMDKRLEKFARIY